MNVKHFAQSLLLRVNGHGKQFFNILSGKQLQHSCPHSPKVHARYFHLHANRCSSKALSHLKSRGVVRLAGPDTLDFLQGLVTNDIHQLSQEGISSQYTMMLNIQGRVLYDLFAYKINQDLANPILLVDVDTSAKGDLVKILKRYKLRKKVDISDVSDEFQVWSKFMLSTDTSVTQSEKSTPENVDEKSTPEDADVVVITLDPRVPSFGKRVIRHGNNDDWITNSVEENVYRQMRYQWGIPEGHCDLPPGNCLPLESNLIFMNGVDFQKGCYIGQELTARTHHTGVTRKRLMPLSLGSILTPSVEHDPTIVNEKGRNVGKFRSSEERHGLGLIRLAHISEDLSLKSGDAVIQVKPHVPAWWPPLELPR